MDDKERLLNKWVECRKKFPADPAVPFDNDSFLLALGEFERVTITGAEAQHIKIDDSGRQDVDMANARCLYSNLRITGESAALSAALSSLWPSAFSHGFQVAKRIYSNPRD